MNVQELNKELGNIDLYLLDQVLKNRISTDSKMLDAGCGEGRNLIYFLNNHYDVYGIDQNPDAIRLLKFIVKSSYPEHSKGNFSIGALTNLPYDKNFFDYIICSAVLHFAQSLNDFWLMIDQLSSVVKPGGTLFIRTTSDIGISGQEDQGEGKFLLPDGSIRFLITETIIQEIKEKYNYTNIEPTKSILVDHQRSMTTLVLKKENK